MQISWLKIRWWIMEVMMVLGNEKQLRAGVSLHTLLFLEHPLHDYDCYGSLLVHSVVSVFNCQNLFFIHLYLENLVFLHTRYQVLDFFLYWDILKYCMLGGWISACKQKKCQVGTDCMIFWYFVWYFNAVTKLVVTSWEHF